MAIKASHRFENLRVLVVDDNAALRGLLRVSLQAFGCAKVIEAGTVSRALETLNTESVDVVITDWKMQPHDGLHLVRTLRDHQLSPNPYMPVIMLTAYSDEQKLNQAKDCGVNAFLVKPFTAESLARGLCDVITDDRPFIQTQDFFGPDRSVHPRDDARTGNFNQAAIS